MRYNSCLPLSLPSFSNVNQLNSALLPASFVLVLPRPIPVAAAILKRIAQLTSTRSFFFSNWIAYKIGWVMSKPNVLLKLECIFLLLFMMLFNLGFHLWVIQQKSLKLFSNLMAWFLLKITIRAFGLLKLFFCCFKLLYLNFCFYLPFFLHFCFQSKKVLYKLCLKSCMTWIVIMNYVE